MTLEEALLIAQRMEDDRVCGPVGLALRAILAEYKFYKTEYQVLANKLKEFEK